jgi:predicted DNA-binding transcriptional regulator AlpA
MSNPIPPTQRPALLDSAGIAALLGVSKTSLNRFVKAGQFPFPNLRVGTRPRWTAESVNRWITGQSSPNDTGAAETEAATNEPAAESTPAEPTFQ